MNDEQERELQGLLENLENEIEEIAITGIASKDLEAKEQAVKDFVKSLTTYGC